VTQSGHSALPSRLAPAGARSADQLDGIRRRCHRPKGRQSDGLTNARPIDGCHGASGETQQKSVMKFLRHVEDSKRRIRVTRPLIATCALAAGLVFAGYFGQAQATAPIAPLFKSAAQASLVAKAAWRCLRRKCVWVPGYVAFVPPFAAAWGPPPYAGCYWKLGALGRWKLICP
jgi:hypothetical protein